MGKDLKGKELGQGIVQRKNGTYCARFVDRYGKRVSIYDKKLSDLRKRLAKEVHENELKVNVIDKSVTLDEWFDKWMKVYKVGEIRGSSVRVYTQIYTKHVSPLLGKFKLVDITQLQIKALLNDMKQYSYEVRNKTRIVLTDMFNKAMDNSLVAKNPVKGIRIIAGKKKSVTVLSVEDQEDFLTCANGTFYGNMMLVQLLTGLRPGEMYGLKICDLDFDNNCIYVRRTLSYDKWEGEEHKSFKFGPPKTKSSDRVIPMSCECKLVLKKQLLQKRIVMRKTCKVIAPEFEDLVFTTKFGTPICTMDYTPAIKKIVDEINLCRDVTEEIGSISPHCLRHTFATRCFESGIDFKTIQHYLGHATLQMTMDLYVHVTQDKLVDEIPKLDALLNEIKSMKDELILQRFEQLKQIENKVVELPIEKMA